MPMVSVVITTKNRQQLLPRAIESVLAQSYPDLEVIVVDDGSDVPVTWPGADPRVQVIRNDKSLGLSAARNRGFSEAVGKFLCMLDDDDFYFPDKLEKQLTFLDANPEIDLVFSQVVVQDAAGNRRHYLADNHVHDPRINLLAYNVIHPASVLFRREVFDKIQFEPRIKKYEDTLFFNRVCFTFKTAYFPMDAAVWMQDGRPDQLTRVFYKRNFDNFKIVCEGLPDVLGADRKARKLYYGRLGFQSLRCFYLLEACRCFFKAL